MILPKKKKKKIQWVNLKVFLANGSGTTRHTLGGVGKKNVNIYLTSYIRN